MHNLRKYKSGDEEQILDLFEVVFKKKLSTDFWNWRFRDNVLNETTIRVVEENEKIIAHYATSPINFLVDNSTVKAALSMTTMTHPEHNGKGYFKRLAGELFTDLQTDDYAFVYGFPNLNSHFGFINSLAWQDVERIPVLQLRESLFANVLTCDTNIEFNAIDLFTDQHFLLFEQYTSNYRIKLKRDAKYMNWRYKAHPENTYQCFGDEKSFVVYKTYNNAGSIEIDICEWIVPADLNYIKAVFLHILKNPALTNSSIKAINLWLPLNDPRHLLLEKIGINFGHNLTFLAYRPLGLNPGSNISDWYYSFGDSDIY